MYNKSLFEVQVHDLYKGNDKVDLSERLTYPCTGCVTVDHKIKPHFSYDIIDDRCVKNKLLYEDKNAIEQIITYEIEPIVQSIESCIHTYNSLYNTVNGRYIRIFKNNSQFKISFISVHGRHYNGSKLDSFIFTQLQNTNNYPTKLTSTLLNDKYLENNAYIMDSTIILDLGDIKTIGFVDIIDFLHNGSFSLNGAILEVLDDVGKVVYQKSITQDHIISSNLYNITVIDNKPNTIPINYGTDVIHRRIMVNQKPVHENIIRPIISEFNYPCGTGCLTDYSCSESECLIKNYIYNDVPNGRCFKPIRYVNKKVLDDIINNPNSIIPSNTFLSCSDLYDTTSSLPMGRFIRLQSTIPNNSIKLLKFYAKSVDSFIQPVDYTIIPYIANNVSAYNILLSANIINNTTSIETGQEIGIYSYIQLDLGFMQIIKEIYLDPIISNLQISIINEDADIISEYSINS